MTRKLSVLVDLDGIAADLHTAWHERALLCCGPGGQHAPLPELVPPTLEEVLQVYDGWTRLPCRDHVFEHLDHNLFDGLTPIPGALWGIDWLVKAGHEVTIVTASAKDPQSAAAKLQWCERVLGLGRHSVIIAQRKHLIRGDVLIDDAPKNLRSWLELNPRGLGMTIAYPYNTDVPPGVYRAESWKEPTLAWGQMIGRISRYLADGLRARGELAEERP